MPDLLETFWASLKASAWTLSLSIYELLFFNKNRTLRAIDYELKRRYLLNNQYAVSRREGSTTLVSERELTYGETPWITIDHIFSLIEVEPDDVFLDLGSGTGRVAFFMHACYGIPVFGIEIIPTFVEQSQAIVRELQLPDVTFVGGDMFREDWSRATIVYIAGTCFDDETIARIADKLKDNAPGTRVITVSYPLEAPHLEMVGSRTLPYSWGVGTIYVHYRV